MSQEVPSPFLRLPLEIRLLIYRLLLIDNTPQVTEARNLASAPSYHLYEKNDEDVAYTPHRILSFRNINPAEFHKHQSKLRAQYKIREGRFRAQCMPTTYNCINNPEISTNILAVNHQIHEEAARILYTGYTFDFDTHIEACIPFLSDLTPYSQSFVRRIRVVKRALPYEKDFDRCEWTNMCKYIAQNLSLVTLSLGVVSGKPFIGWDEITPFPESEIESIVQKHKRDEMTWVRDLMLIKGLKNLDVSPCIEHCPPPASSMMGFFVAFSASVTDGFTNYLTNRMLQVAQAA